MHNSFPETLAQYDNKQGSLNARPNPRKSGGQTTHYHSNKSSLQLSARGTRQRVCFKVMTRSLLRKAGIRQTVFQNKEQLNSAPQGITL